MALNSVPNTDKYGLIHIDFRGPTQSSRGTSGEFVMFPAQGNGIPGINVHGIKNIEDIDKIAKAWGVIS